ncbi:MAG: hypothetical protein FJ291_01435 [Planctomycetes bacterium]|nr:hypothetical protein [Planctomycetota bacterium]
MPRCPLASVLALLLAACAPGAEPDKSGPVPQLPNLRLDLKAKTVEIDGTFCVGEYPLELLACHGTMKDYESMVSSPCKPSVLHMALLALGLKPRVRDEKEPGKVLREGDPVELLLRFTKDGKELTVEPHEVIINVETKKRIAGTSFVFFGSFLFPDPMDKTKMIYLGDAENWLIGLLGDTASVIDQPADAAGKYGALAIDTKAVPPKGSKVTLIIRPAAKRPDKPEAPKAPPEGGALPREFRILIKPGGTKAQPAPEFAVNGTPARDLAEAIKALEGLAAKHNGLDVPVVLDPDDDAQHGWVMKVLDELHRLKFRTISFAQ